MAEEKNLTKFDGTIAFSSPVESELFYKADETTILNSLYNTPDIYKLKDVTFGMPSRGEIIIDKPAFLMNLSSMYCHFLFDNVGSFYGIKNIINNINPFFVKMNESSTVEKNIFNEEWLKSEGYDPSTNIVYPNIYKYTFKNVYDFSINDRKRTMSTFFDFPIHFVKKNIYKNAKENINLPKKIFITRTDSSTRGSSTYDTFNFELFFASKGFTVVSLSGMKMQDQIDLFFNATDIVCVSGSGLSNMVFCKEGTNIVSINPAQHIYIASIWSRISKVCNLKYTEISINQNNRNAKDYIETLKNSTNYMYELFY